MESEQKMVNPPKGTAIQVNGIHFSSISAAARHFGLQPKLVDSRLRKGWSVDEAFGLCERQKRTVGSRAKEISVDGKLYPSRTALCEAYGISKAMFYHRTTTLGMSCEEAISFGKTRGIECNGVRYPSIAALAREHSLNPGTLVSRLRSGMSPVQAVSAPIQKYKRKKGGSIYQITNNVEGKSYIGLTKATLETRLNSHFKAAKNGRGGRGSLHEAMRNFLRAAFSIKKIATADSSRRLQELERNAHDPAGQRLPNPLGLPARRCAR